MHSSRTAQFKKVPEVTHLFWVIKVLTTAMGEILSDYLVTHHNPVYVVSISTFLLGIVFCIQLFSKSYAPWRYWLTVSMVAVVGTMVADITHIVLGVPYLISTMTFAIILGLIFLMWYKKEKSLSIHSVYTKPRELFYWATIVATFALGTATGDLTAMTLGIGYLVSGILFALLIAIPAFIYIKTKRHEVLWFWSAYILTRPLGASFADWFGKPHSLGGLALGEGLVSLTLIILIVILVVFVSLKSKKLPS